MMKIGFIGVGSMGLLMIRNLIKAGFEVTAFDIAPEAMEKLSGTGAKSAASAREAAENCEIVVTIVPESKDTREAVFGENGVMESLKPGAVFIDMGTGSPTTSREIAKAFGTKGVGFLDAPVSGGVGKAATGELSIMASGNKEDYDRAMPVFKALGTDIFYVGDVGTGHTIKLINNLLTGVNLAAVCEGMVLGMKAGIDPELLMNIINTSSGESYSSRVKVKNFIMQRKFDAGFKAKLQHKDMNLATTLARELKVPLMLGNLAQQYYMTAMAEGKGELDASVIVTLLEKITGVEVKP